MQGIASREKTMISFNNSNTAKLTLASGIICLIATITLIAFLITESEAIGWLGDVLFAINRALLIPLILALGAIVLPKQSILSRLILICGLGGVLVMVVSGLLLISTIMPYEQTVKGESFGAGLIGVAIFIFAVLNLNEPNLGLIYKWFAVLIGIALASNILAVIFPEAAQAVTDGTATMETVNPLVLIIMSVMGPLYLFGWPIWLILTGRAFSKEKLSIPQ